MSSLTDVEAELNRLLGLRLQPIIELLTGKPLIEIPDPSTMDRPIEELESLVARTSNTYGTMAESAGTAHAIVKLARGRYDRKQKKHRVGRNDAERDRVAMEACEDEHREMTVAEAIATLADSYEGAARVASESARKILDKARARDMAQRREEKGMLRDSDYSSSY